MGRSYLNRATVTTVLNVVIPDASVVCTAGKVSIILRKAQRVYSIFAHCVTSEGVPVFKFEKLNFACCVSR